MTAYGLVFASGLMTGKDVTELASIGGGADEVMLGILAKIMGIAKKPHKA